MWAEIIGVITAFALMVWAIAGEYLFGIYGGTYFLPLLAFPAVNLIRFHGLDAASFQLKKKPRIVSFDVVYPILVAALTFAAIPYFCALAGILPQDTPLHALYTGTLEHAGIHHGWVGWYFVLDGYLYDRVNCHARVNLRLGELWRNAMLATGLFLFLEDYWGEEVTAGVLKWPDIFHAINGLLPFSWNTNFFIEIVIFTTGTATLLFANLRYRLKLDAKLANTLRILDSSNGL